MMWISMLMLQVVVEYHGVDQHVDVTGGGSGISWCRSACSCYRWWWNIIVWMSMLMLQVVVEYHGVDQHVDVTGGSGMSWCGSAC